MRVRRRLHGRRLLRRRGLQRRGYFRRLQLRLVSAPMTRALALGVLALALAGCGGDDGDDGGGAPASINSGPVTGKVGGASWTLATAQTDAFLSEGDEFWVD